MILSNSEYRSVWLSVHLSFTFNKFFSELAFFIFLLFFYTLTWQKKLVNGKYFRSFKGQVCAKYPQKHLLKFFGTFFMELTQYKILTIYCCLYKTHFLQKFCYEVMTQNRFDQSNCKILWSEILQEEIDGSFGVWHWDRQTKKRKNLKKKSFMLKFVEDCKRNSSCQVNLQVSKWAEREITPFLLFLNSASQKRSSKIE